MLLLYCLLLLAPSPLPQTIRPKAELVKLSAPLASGVVHGWAGAPVLSPDGTRVLFLQEYHRTSVETRLFVRPLDASSAPLWLDSGAIVLARWSPDGTRIVYGKVSNDSRLTGLYSVPTDGSGAPVQLVTLGAGTDLAGIALTDTEGSLAITADSTRVVVRLTSSGTTQLHSLPIDGGAPLILNAPLVSGGQVSRLIGVTSANAAVYLADALTDERYELFAVPADGSAPPLTLSALAAGQSVVWFGRDLPELAPLGQHVLFHGMPVGSFTTNGFHAARTDTSASSVQLASVAVDPVVTSDGGTVVHARLTGAGRQNVWSVPIDGSAPATALASVSVGVVAALGLSPDGQRLFAVNSGGPTQLVTANIDGTGIATLHGHSIDFSKPPRYSPDSATLAFHESSVGVQAMPSDGSLAPHVVVPLAPPFVVLQRGFDLTDTHVVAHGPLLGASDELIVAPLAIAGLPERLNPPLGAGVEVEDFVVTPGGEFVLASYTKLASELAEGPAPLHRLRLDLTDTLEFQEPYPIEVIGDVRAYDAHGGWAVYLADQDSARVVELYSRPVSEAGVPIKLNGTLVAGGDVLDFRLSRDGRTVIFLADALIDGKNELFAVPSDGSAPPVQLNATFGDAFDVDVFELSPDGRGVVYHDTRFPSRLRSVLSTGGTVLNLAAGVTPFEITPDSTRVLFHPQSTISLSSIPIGGGPIANLDGGHAVYEHSLSPDGTWVGLLVSEDVDTPEEFESLYAVPITGGTPVRLSPPAVSNGAIAAFALSDERAVFLGDLLVEEDFLCFSAPLDASTAAVVVNGPLPVDSDVTDFAIDRAREHVIYVARHEVAYQDFEWQLHSVPILGGASPLLLAEDPDVSFGHPRILEGGRVLFENGSTLRTVPGPGGAIQTVLSALSPWRYELSQDERRVVFVDPNGIQTVSSRGGAVTTLAAPVQLDVLQTFRQDGPVVLFQSRTGEVEELYASHYRPRSRQAATPTETRTR